MFKNLIISIAKDDFFDVSSDKMKKLQDLVGKGDFNFPKSIAWADMEFIQRMKLIEMFINDRIGDIIIENIDEKRK